MSGKSLAKEKPKEQLASNIDDANTHETKKIEEERDFSEENVSEMPTESVLESKSSLTGSEEKGEENNQ